MYLFFINCFFICLSAVVVLKIMHVHAKQEISGKVLRKQKIYVMLVGIITVLPSVYLAYQMINTSAVNSQFSSFISKQFDFDETQVVSKSLDTQNGTRGCGGQAPGQRHTGCNRTVSGRLQPAKGHEAVPDADGIYGRYQ